MLSSTFAVEEARRNLARNYPGCLALFEPMVAGLDAVAAGRAGACPMPLPEKDRPILAAALQAGASQLLTGDLHDLGPFRNDANETAVDRVQIVTEFLRDAFGQMDRGDL